MTLFHVIPNLNSGGAENFLVSLSKELINDYKQYVFTFRNPEQDDLYSKFSSKIKFIYNKKELIETIKINGKAAVICWMYPSIIFIEKLKLFAKIEAKIIWNIRHSSFTKYQIKQKAGILFLGLISRFRNPYIIYCAFASKKIHQKYGFSKRRNQVILNGLIKVLNFIQYKEQQKPYLLYVGRFNYAKGGDILIDIFNEYSKSNPSLILKIVGHGWDLEKIPRPLKSRILLFGNQDDLAPFYAQAEGFLFTSRTEGYPNVLAEACSFGLPIITTNAGDAKVILKDYPHGCIVDSKEKFLEELLLLKKKTVNQREKVALEFRHRNTFLNTREAYLKLFKSL